MRAAAIRVVTMTAVMLCLESIGVLAPQPAWATEEIVLETVFDPDMMSYVVDSHNIQRVDPGVLGCTFWMPVVQNELAWVTLEFPVQEPIQAALLSTALNCHWPGIPSEAWLWVGPSQDSMTLLYHIVSGQEAGQLADISNIVHGSRTVFVKAELFRGLFWAEYPEQVQFMRHCTGTGDALTLTVTAARPSGFDNCTTALHVDAPAEQLQIPHSPSLDLTNAITIEAWGWFDGSESTPAIEIVKRGDANRGYVLHATPTGWPGERIVGGIFDAHTNLILPPSASLTGWHHYAWTFDGSISRVFFDGALLQELPFSGSIGSTTSDLHLGIGVEGDGTWNGGTAEGWYDEIRIWDHARTLQEIALWHDVPLTGPQPGLVGYWNFDAGDGIDQSGLGNNGTASTGVTFENACAPINTQPITWGLLKRRYQ